MLEEGYRTFREDRCWQLYCTIYPKMTNETFQTFEEFQRYLTAPEEHHTKEEILGNVEQILEKFSFVKQ